MVDEVVLKMAGETAWTVYREGIPTSTHRMAGAACWSVTCKENGKSDGVIPKNSPASG